MPCFYCGKRISMVRQMADQDFCSDEHRRRYQELGDAILRRLSESDSRPASRNGRGAARQAAAASTPAPPASQVRPSASKIIVPPQSGAIGGRLPVPSGLISAFIAAPAETGFADLPPALPELDAGLPQGKSPASFGFLRAAASSPGVVAGSHAHLEPPRTFESRPAGFGGFAPRRRFVLGPRSFGFFLIAPEFCGRFARQRSAPAPRFPKHSFVLPEVPVQPAANAICPAASGAIALMSAPAVPVAAAPRLAPFEVLAPAAARLAFRPFAPTEASAGEPAQPLAANRVCEWRISLPSPVSLSAAQTAGPVPVTPTLSHPVFPDVAARSRIHGTVVYPGLLPSTAPPLSPPAGQWLRSGAVCDSWPVLVDPRLPAPVSRRIELRADLPQAGAMAQQLTRPQPGPGVPSAVPAPLFAMWPVRTPGSRWDERVAGMQAPGWYRQAMPAARTRPAEPTSLLRPPILTVVPVLPDVTAETAWQPRSQFGFNLSLPALAHPRTAERCPVSELALSGAAPSWPRLAVAAGQRRLPPAQLAPTDLSLSPIRPTPVAAEPLITASAIRMLSRGVRTANRALPPGEALPFVPHAAHVTSRYLPAGGAPIARSAAMPSVPSGLCSSRPPAAPPWRHPILPQTGGPAPRVFGFLQTPFRGALRPRFEHGGPERTVQMIGLAPCLKAALHGFAPSSMPAVSAPALTLSDVRVPASPLPGALAQLLPPPSVTPLSAPAKAVKIAASVRGTGTEFSTAARLFSLAIPAPAPRTIPVQGLLPSRLIPMAIRHTAEVAAVDMAVSIPRAGHLRRAAICAGLSQAAALPVSGHVVNAPAIRSGEEWLIPPPGAIEFSRAATQSMVSPRLTPARAVIANVRLTVVPLACLPRALSEAPAFPLITLMPVTSAFGRPAVASVELIREGLPVVRENAAGLRPALCTQDLQGPEAVAVLNRAAPLPRPGYPAFSFKGYEALDLDDDDTCVLAGAVEPEPPAPVLPRRRTSVPPVRVLALCEPLLYQSEGREDSRPALRPGATVDFTLQPGLLVMPAGISLEMDDEGYPIAAGEGLQPRVGWRVGSRLFR